MSNIQIGDKTSLTHSIKLEFLPERLIQLETFICHLETLSGVTFVLVGQSTLLLQFEACRASEVYYQTELDNIKNNPLIAVGVDCSATTHLTDWDMEQLEMKSFVSGWRN